MIMVKAVLRNFQMRKWQSASHEAINIIACDELAKSYAIMHEHIAKRDEHATWFQKDCANKANFLLLMSIADCAPPIRIGTDSKILFG